MTPVYRILFLGTPEFAVPSLQALIDGPDQVVAAVCQPDREKGRGRQPAPPPVKQLAGQYGIPVLQPASVRKDDFQEIVRGFDLDLIIVAAYGKILPGKLLHLPRLGTINVHGSLLPKYRGAAPIQWALLNGENETGVTIMQMDEGMDTGDILLPASLPIGEEDTAGTLFTKLAHLGAKTLSKAITLLKAGELIAVKQDDSQATPAPMLDKEMGHLDWSMNSRALHHRIRGLDPWPSAYSFFEGKRVRFFRPAYGSKDHHQQPGTILQADRNGLRIATGDGSLVIRELQLEGKKRMDVYACLCGMALPPGARFF